ncbi:MAG: pyrroline-5-carboxylate reductase [Desulfosalsimonas sp.]
MPEYRKIGFIGAGNMAEAIIGAILNSRLRQPHEIIISDASAARREEISERYDVVSAASNFKAAEACDIIILAVKPQIIDTVLTELADQGCFKIKSHRRLFISIAAGIKLSSLEQIIYANCTDREKSAMPIIRVMPNTPALVGAGMSGMCANSQAVHKDIQHAAALLSSMGEVLIFDEDKMDAVTAVSGSGPAYGFYLLEAMIEAGRELGLKSEDASKLAQGAISGALALLKHVNEDAGTLRSKVTSPGGTTEAAIKVLEAHHVKDRIVEAVLAAARRSRELSLHKDA